MDLCTVLIDTDSDPGAWADALAHSVHIAVSDHTPSTAPGAARAVVPTPHGGTGTPDHRSFHIQKVAQP